MYKYRVLLLPILGEASGLRRGGGCLTVSAISNGNGQAS